MSILFKAAPLNDARKKEETQLIMLFLNARN